MTLAVVALQLAGMISGARAFDASRTDHCTDAVVWKQRSNLLPTMDNNNGVAVIRKSVDDARSHASNVECLYQILVVKKRTDAPGAVVVWDETMTGPGVVFAGGVWRPTWDRVDIAVETPRSPVTPDQQDLLVYRHDEGMDGGVGTLRLIHFISNGGAAQVLLSLSGRNGLQWHWNANILTVEGSFVPRGGSFSSAQSASVSLRWASDVGQFAVVGADPEAIQFYQQLIGGRPNGSD